MLNFLMHRTPRSLPGFAGALLLSLCILADAALCTAGDQSTGMTASAWSQPAHSQAPSASIDEKARSKAIPIPKTIGRTDTTTDPAGKLSSYQPGGATATASNAFFQSLGTNGRSCFSCHSPNDGWSISSADAAARFKKTSGADPVFRLVDGATCPNDDVSTIAAMQRAYQLLLGEGLIRISLPMPSSVSLQFSITSVNDPYNCNTDPEFGLTSPTTGMVSVYRRPLPATNLKFESTLMWDGREPNLDSQAADATTIHAQSSAPPDSAELRQIVDFETGIFTAQSRVQGANLASGGASGGPVALSTQSFFTGINDPFGRNPMGTAFDPNIFDLFGAWASAGKGRTGAAKESIERGAQIFNTQTFTISGVTGLNDVIGQTSITGTCGTCHDTPNVGNQSVVGTMDIGTSNPLLINSNALPLPAFTIQCDAGPLAGQTFVTFDPGRAMITGQCEDIGKVKVPALRGFAARAPYFHNGSAPDASAILNFYMRRFPSFELTAQQMTDLANFLNSL
jgi:cytochrome c peroxidase